MKRDAQGHYVAITTVGEVAHAFVPPSSTSLATVATGDADREKLRSKMLQRAAESWLGTNPSEHLCFMKQFEHLKTKYAGLNSSGHSTSIRA